MLQYLIAFIASNWWRSAALVLLVIGSVQSIRVDMIKRSATSCAVSLRQAGEQIGIAARSAEQWQQTAQKAVERLNAITEQLRVRAERDEAARKEAERRRAEADRLLTQWMRRYADAIRDPDCRRLMETPLCAI